MRPVGAIWVAIVGTALVSAYAAFVAREGKSSLAAAQQQLATLPDDLAAARQSVGAAASEAVRSIEDLQKRTASSISDRELSSHERLDQYVGVGLAAKARALSDREAAALEQRLAGLSKQVTEREGELARTTEALDRTKAGLPEKVELDSLEQEYGALTQPGATGKVDFQTGAGPLYFHRKDVALMRVPSTGKLAWIRIGKKQATESEALIRAWLGESSAAKERLGYRRDSSTTRPSDYGKVTEESYSNGDMYFKTYFQFERVLETYGRHSMQYTYYIEVGSRARKDQFQLEQYNKKLGS